ncbi:MAG: AAA family ATPase [Chloroflexota bacterium]
MDNGPGHSLIGRAAELDRLAGANARAAAGESRTVIVAGEAGIGKTRLVEAFAARVISGGGRVLVGGSLALGSGGLPYAPFVEAFRALLRDVDPGALPALLGPNRGELARLMPEVRPRPDRPASDAVGAEGTAFANDDRFAQVRLFELVLGLIDRLARMAPLVLVVEDLQWADPSTRDLLAFLVRNLRGERILVVVTIRSDEIDPRSPFMTYLAELERADRVDRLDLDRLDRDEVAALLAQTTGRRVDPGLVDRVWRRTGGNPFYAEQVAAMLDGRDDGELPARLRDIVIARLATLSEAAQEVVRVASAAGRRVDDDLVAAVAGLSAPAVRRGLHELVDRRVLIASGGRSDPHYTFSHALLQEAVHADLFPGERARLHGAYALTLEARSADRTAGRPAVGPAPSASELAFHWDAAGDDGRALPVTVEAAQAAERAYAFPEAHARYLRALELWDRVAGRHAAAPAIDRIDLLVRAAETAVMSGEYTTAIELGRQAIASVDADADPDRVGALQERQRWYLWEAGDRVAAEAAVAEALRLVPARPPSEARARILGQQAGLLMTGGRFAESIPVAEEALDMARAVGSPSNEAFALGILGWDLALTGRVDDGLERVRAGLAIADDLGGPEGIALGATNLAVLLDRVGRTDEALQVATDGWERARAIGVERTYGGLLLAIAAKAAIALGRWDEAESFLTLGLASQPVGVPGIRLRIQRGRLDTFRGELASAAEALTAARAADEVIGGSEDRAPLLAALAELAATGGRATETRAAVIEGLGMASGRVPDPALASLAATGLRVEADLAARARARRDDAELDDARTRARAIGEQVERIAAMLGVAAAAEDAAIPPSRQAVLTALCRTEARRLDDRDEPAAWARIAEGFDAIGRPFPAAYGRFRQAAALLRDRGSREEARVALGDARGTAERLGAKPLLGEIDLLARQGRLDLVSVRPTSAGTPPAADGADLGLTDREREVLRLIAAGWSNQEIADALFISRKTASVHASNIFDKLGVASRGEAAALAHRVGLAADDPG